MGDALHAEWTKLRTISEPSWLLLSVVVLTVAVSAAVGLGVLSAWAAAALLAGGIVLRLRDA